MWNSGGGSFGVVDDVLQLLAGLEERDLLRRHFDAVAGLGIAADASFALTRAEAAESAYLDFVAGAQRTNNTVENGFDDDLRVFAGHFCQSRYFFDQVGFRHERLPVLDAQYNLKFYKLLASKEFNTNQVFWDK